ncbi:MAG TPA: methyltransferase domain-containing protein, partial [Acidimicrobiales bacterium]|nr:methyltransferase domain-containing protein [Acidimicrobiales bacterium]
MRVVGPAKPNPELAAIEVSAMRGLEIGPLANPRIRKSDGQVFYLDRSSTEELRSKYAENETLRPHIGSLVDVDFVQRDGMNLSETVGSHAPFDYVVASHVVEHIPNLIGWLQDVASVLRVGGILALVVPDKRYCFDTNRTPTEMSDLVDSHLRQLSHPSYRHIYDNFSRTVTVDGMVDTVGLWEGTVDYAGTVRSDVPNPGLAAFQMCLAHRDQPDTPIDIHCHAFTPESFLR